MEVQLLGVVHVDIFLALECHGVSAAEMRGVGVLPNAGLDAGHHARLLLDFDAGEDQPTIDGLPGAAPPIGKDLTPGEGMPFADPAGGRRSGRRAVARAPRHGLLVVAQQEVVAERSVRRRLVGYVHVVGHAEHDHPAERIQGQPGRHPDLTWLELAGRGLDPVDL